MSPKAATPRHKTSADTKQAGDELMKTLVHPAKKLVEALRATILEVSPSILEGVKWNSPSFRTTEYFATTNLREKKGVGVILHFGAKARDVGAVREAIADPAGLLRWLAADRATVAFESVSDLESKKGAFQAIVRQWIGHV